MTVYSTDSRWDYIQIESIDTFEYKCEIYLKTDLKVYVSGSLKIVDVHYIVTGSPPFYGINNPDGGNIVFYPDYIPAVGAPIAIILDLPLTQLTDYKEGDKFPAETHERALDRLIKIAQSFNNVLGRILKVPLWSPLSNIIVEMKAGWYLRWNSTLTGIICDSGTTIGAHGESHTKDGGDPIKLDDLDTPDDNTDLNASSLKHGLMSKADKAKLDGIDISIIYPIGSIYISTISTNPSTLFGFGTWVAFGAGRVLVGLDATQPEFDAVEETGGAKTVNIAHTHTGPSHTHSGPSHTHSIGQGTAAPGAETTVDTAGITGAGGTGSTGAGGTGATGAMSANEDPSTLQPYIVVYCWKRTA